jgi:hypothetical protein
VVERTVAGTYTVSGSISMNPGATVMTDLLQFITGGTPSGSNPVTYPLGETLTSFNVVINRIAQTHTFTTCYIDKMTLRATQGGLVEMTLDIEGLTESIAGSVSGTPVKDIPYVFQSAVLTIAGTSYQFREVTFTIDNHLKKDRFMNSVSRTDLPTLDRTVSIALSLPYTSDETGLYDTNATSAAVVLTFTDGTNTLTITMAAASFPTEPPVTPGREEILLPYNGVARMTGTTKELVITQ